MSAPALPHSVCGHSTWCLSEIIATRPHVTESVTANGSETPVRTQCAVNIYGRCERRLSLILDAFHIRNMGTQRSFTVCLGCMHGPRQCFMFIDNRSLAIAVRAHRLGLDTRTCAPHVMYGVCRNEVYSSNLLSKVLIWFQNLLPSSSRLLTYLYIEPG